MVFLLCDKMWGYFVVLYIVKIWYGGVFFIVYKILLCFYIDDLEGNE